MNDEQIDSDTRWFLILQIVTLNDIFEIANVYNRKIQFDMSCFILIT